MDVCGHINYTEMLLVPKLKEMLFRNKGNHDMEKGVLSLPDEKSLTERLRGSAIPHMRRLLNKHERKKRIFADKFKF